MLGQRDERRETIQQILGEMRQSFQGHGSHWLRGPRSLWCGALVAVVVFKDRGGHGNWGGRWNEYGEIHPIWKMEKKLRRNGRKKRILAVRRQGKWRENQLATTWLKKHRGRWMEKQWRTNLPTITWKRWGGEQRGKEGECSDRHVVGKVERQAEEELAGAENGKRGMEMVEG